jgi:hypothetical protein
MALFFTLPAAFVKGEMRHEGLHFSLFGDATPLAI